MLGAIQTKVLNFIIQRAQACAATCDHSREVVGTAGTPMYLEFCVQTVPVGQMRWIQNWKTGAQLLMWSTTRTLRTILRALTSLLRMLCGSSGSSCGEPHETDAG